ncbi:hypothetical protein [Streptomyces sp. NPDC001530]|uniref:hypothetical protein n=1 Tax=Streptomyces sp. NPDC001530 TaxID=3364582 RepID=UPI0036C05087
MEQLIEAKREHREPPKAPEEAAPGGVVGLMAALKESVAKAQASRLRFAGGAAWEKTRRLAEPAGHDDDLRTLAYQLTDAAGLQRGRLTGLALRGEDLVDADQIAQQISFDDAREARLVAEAVIDHVREKFGPRIIGPAAVHRRAS